MLYSKEKTYAAALGSLVVLHHSACFLINCFTLRWSLLLRNSLAYSNCRRSVNISSAWFNGKVLQSYRYIWKSHHSIYFILVSFQLKIVSCVFFKESWLPYLNIVNYWSIIEYKIQVWIIIWILRHFSKITKKKKNIQNLFFIVCFLVKICSLVESPLKW